MNLSNVTNIKIPEGNVVKIVSGSDVLWEKDYSKEYFTLTFDDEIGTITMKLAVYWSEDKKTWTEAVADSTITPNSKTVYFKQTGTSLGIAEGNLPDTELSSKVFVVSKDYSVSGNTMSLLYGDDFIGKTRFPDTSVLYIFGSLLADSPLISAKNMILPATTLVKFCYVHMFFNCTKLVDAPELPATTLASSCYQYMFWGCTSLTTAPELPATTLIDYCYSYMFQGCTSLTTAPELPATTLASYCYQYMFSGCTSLTSLKAEFTTILYSALRDWLADITTTGKFYKPVSATYDDTALNLPSTWTVETY